MILDEFRWIVGVVVLRQVEWTSAFSYKLWLWNVLGRNLSFVWKVSSSDFGKLVLISDSKVSGFGMEETWIFL